MLDDLHVSSQFDSGNIKCLSCEDPSNIQLAIKKDKNSDFYQWFHFRLTGAKNKNCVMKILNAGGAAYTDGFQGYQAVASYDRETWFRIETDFDGRVLTLTHTPEKNAIYFAYFAPYSMERHNDLIADALNSPLVDLINLGHTVDGHDMDLLKISRGDDDGKLKVWFIGRQHPGETMAEWWMEGFLGRILDEDDPVSRTLIKQCVFYVIPNMNPDGSARGHLRTNAVGANLNREWWEPDRDRSPEVFHVREKMLELGVDFFMDVHGDEALPYNFISGSEGVPSWNEQRQELLDTFLQELCLASPDFQTKYGYELDAPGSANLTKATNYVAEHFKCLAMTLEMPFKDTVECPCPEEGWSPNRCGHLAEACIEALHRILPRLKK